MSARPGARPRAGPRRGPAAADTVARRRRAEAQPGPAGPELEHVAVAQHGLLDALAERAECPGPSPRPAARPPRRARAARAWAAPPPAPRPWASGRSRCRGQAAISSVWPRRGPERWMREMFVVDSAKPVPSRMLSSARGRRAPRAPPRSSSRCAAPRAPPPSSPSPRTLAQEDLGRDVLEGLVREHALGGSRRV